MLPFCREAVSVFYSLSQLGYSLGESYPSAEKQLVYSTAPADWAIVWWGRTNTQNITLLKYKNNSITLHPYLISTAPQNSQLFLLGVAVDLTLTTLIYNLLGQHHQIPCPATTHIANEVLWLWQVLVNYCFQSGVLDYRSLVKPSRLDEILNLVNLSHTGLGVWVKETVSSEQLIWCNEFSCNKFTGDKSTIQWIYKSNLPMINSPHNEFTIINFCGISLHWKMGKIWKKRQLIGFSFILFSQHFISSLCLISHRQ